MDTLPKVPTITGILENITFQGRKLEKKEIDKLLKLKFKEDTLFSLKDRDFISESLEILNILGFDEGYKYLKGNQKEQSREVIIKNSPLYDSSRRRNFLDITKDLRTVKVESHFQCPKCKQYHIDTISKQTRSADEGMTDYHRCSDCGYQWRE